MIKRKSCQPLDVAIVGMACRFPGARDLFAYWSNVLAGVDSTSDVPPDRWDPRVFFDPESTDNDRVYCRRGGYLEAPIEFDASAHGVVPSAVEGGEPEQFLILDTARAALVDAGLGCGVPEGRRTDVVIGRGNYFNRGNLTRLQHGRIVAQTVAILRSLHPEWPEHHFEAVRADLKASLPPFSPATIPGQLTNATAGLVANRLNLTGSSYVIDAASASALVALESAARALVDRRCDLALAGAIFLAVDIDFPMVFSQLGALSKGGLARPFARNADGTLPGEGVGVLVVKRLADAERDRDRIYAILKGIGLASDGKGRGLASPSARGHRDAMRRAYRLANVDPATVDLVEGHGLGVPAADVAELRALRAVFPKPAHRRRALGAVSSMIGHAMPAAGMAGLIKTALALYHRTLPPTLHAEDPHPLLADDAAPFALNGKARPWIHGERAHPRRAGVNAFGFAGINAHAVLEEHSPSADGLTAGCLPQWDSEAILLGAPDRQAWLVLARALVEWLDRSANVNTPLKDLAYTLNTRQPAFAFRVGLVVKSAADLRRRLSAAIDRLSDPACRTIRDARGTYFWDEPLAGPGALAFLYAGEGSQYPGMLADLCPHFPEVRALFDTADRLAIEQGLSRRPSEAIFGTEAAADEKLWTMGTAVNVVLSAHWALHKLVSRLGLRPDAVLGHSSGEFLSLAAAGIAEIDSRCEDRLGELGTLFERQEDAGQVPSAALVAVAADRDRVEAICREAGLSLQVAMDNCPRQVVLCGAPEAAERLAGQLRAMGILCELLPFARAYHTAEFGPALGPVRSFFEGLPAQPPAIPIYSCASVGKMGEDVERIRQLAVEQWVKPVAFRSTLETMYADGARIFVEIGTRGSLTGFVEDTLRGRPHFAVALNLPRRSGLTQLNHLVASLFAQGVALEPEFLYARRRPVRIDFERDCPEPRKGQALQVGFPEMRLSADLLSKLHTRPEEREGIQSPDRIFTRLEFPVEVERSEQSRTLHSGREQAMLDHLRTMDLFLDTQQQVMAAFLAARGGAAEPVLRSIANDDAHRKNGTETHARAVSHGGDRRRDAVHAEPVRPASTPTSDRNGAGRENGSTLHHDPRDPGAAKPSAAPEPAAVSVERALLEQVSRRTGYPLEMLGLDLDVEGDLGIDSIKRVEILGDLQTRGLVPANADLDQLSRSRTLRQVIEVIGAPRKSEVKVGPWVGDIESHEPGRALVAVRRLDAQTDPVAEHHTLGGRHVSAIDPERKGLPVVPFTVMAEMLAQAAAVLVPGRALLALRSVQANRWIRYEEEPIALEIRAKRDPGKPDEVRVAIYNPGAPETRRAGADGPVVEGVVVFTDARPSAPIAPAFALDEPRQCRFTASELYDEGWLFHGPALQALVHVGPAAHSGIEGTLRVLPRAALFRNAGDCAHLQTDPIVLDAFTHLLGCWGLDEFGDGGGDVIFPLRVGEIAMFGDDPPEGAEVFCRIAVQEVTRHRIRVDAALVRQDGSLWVRITDWEDWRFYWPGRFRDQFRRADRVFVGEVLDLPGTARDSAIAVWLEPPVDMAKPVWGDVMEWVQLGPDERASCKRESAPDSSHALRVWGRVAAKECARRLWLERGLPSVFPADLAIESDAVGQPRIRTLLEPERDDLPAISIAHTEGVAVALGSLDRSARIGIDVEAMAERDAEFEAKTLTADERQWLDRNTTTGIERDEWITRLLCAKVAFARATGHGVDSVQAISAQVSSGEVRVTLGPERAARCTDGSGEPIRVLTARRGDRAWAWTLGERSPGP